MSDKLGGQGTCSVSPTGTVCLRIGSKSPCGRCPIGALNNESCMCDATYTDPQPVNPSGGSSGGSTPAVRRPLVAGLESDGKCLARGISELLRCTEKGRNGSYNTQCDNVCPAEAAPGSYCICRKSTVSKKKDETYGKADDQSDGSKSPSPSKKRKSEGGGSDGGSPAKARKH